MPTQQEQFQLKGEIFEPKEPKNNSKLIFIGLLIFSGLLAILAQKNETPPEKILYTYEESEEIRQVFVQFLKANPEILAEVKKSFEELTEEEKMNRVMNEPGALIDYQLMSWILMVLDRDIILSEDREEIIKKICQIAPKLNICGEQKKQKVDKKQKKEKKVKSEKKDKAESHQHQWVETGLPKEQGLNRPKLQKYRCTEPGCELTKFEEYHDLIML